MQEIRQPRRRQQRAQRNEHRADRRYRPIHFEQLAAVAEHGGNPVALAHAQSAQAIRATRYARLEPTPRQPFVLEHDGSRVRPIFRMMGDERSEFEHARQWRLLLSAGKRRRERRQTHTRHGEHIASPHESRDIDDGTKDR